MRASWPPIDKIDSQDRISGIIGCGWHPAYASRRYGCCSMRIYELIDALQKLSDQHGNIEVKSATSRQTIKGE